MQSSARIMRAHRPPRPDLDALQSGNATALREANRWLAARPAEDRTAWALEHLPNEAVLSSSFGAQAPVMLHLATRLRRDIPVVFVDTGYLFPETYRLVDALQERLELNLQVYRPRLSPAWQEARLGRLWEQGLEGIERYNELNKVEPMERALSELGAGTWLAGLRREQARSRAELPVLRRQDGRFKVHPIVDWSTQAVHRYLQRHDLPDHPLRERGYASIGDWHTTRIQLPGMAEEETRFFGLKRECGLHR